MAMIPSNPPPGSAEEVPDGAEVPEFDWSVLRQEAANTATDNSVIDRSVLSMSLVLRRNISALLYLTNVERVGQAANLIILLRSGLGQQLYSTARLPPAAGRPPGKIGRPQKPQVAGSQRQCRQHDEDFLPYRTKCQFGFPGWWRARRKPGATASMLPGLPPHRPCFRIRSFET